MYFVRTPISKAFSFWILDLHRHSPLLSSRPSSARRNSAVLHALPRNPKNNTSHSITFPTLALSLSNPSPRISRQNHSHRLKKYLCLVFSAISPTTYIFRTASTPSHGEETRSDHSSNVSQGNLSTCYANV